MSRALTPDQVAKLPYRPCVGIMLANSAGHVFVGQRRDNNQAAWQMPQGGIDKGEDNRTAALRELWEETGVTAELVRIEAETATPVTYDLPVELLPRFWGGKFRGQSQHWILMRFIGRDDQINIDTPHPEFSAWRWAAPEELVPGIVDFKRPAYEKVLAAFADRL